MAEQKKRTSDGVFEALKRISDEENIDFGLDNYTADNFRQKYFTGPGNIENLYHKLSQISDEENIDFGQGTADEWLASFGYKKNPDETSQSRYLTLDGKPVGSRKPAGTVHAENGMTFTEAGLDSLEKGAKPVYAAAQKKDFSKPIDLSRPQEYQLPKPFVDDAANARYLADLPAQEFNKYWGVEQREMARKMMEKLPNTPGYTNNFEYLQLALKDAQKAEAARKMKRGEYDAENFDNFYEQHVSGIFGEERRAGERRAKEAIKALPKDNGGGLLSKAIGYVKSDIATERETDPEMIANKTLKRVQSDKAFGDYVLSRMGINGQSSDGGEEPQLTEEEKKWMKALFDVESSEVADQVIQRIYDTYKREGAPKSTLDYIGGKAFHENFVATLYDALIRRAAGSSGMRQQLRAMASAEYGENAGMLTNIVAGAAPFAIDIVTGGFYAPGLVGRAASQLVMKGGVSYATKQIANEMTKRAAARGLSGTALREATSGAAGMAERYVATQAPILNLAVRTAGSAANFATYDVQSELTRQIAEGEFKPINLMKEAGKGAVLGGTMGVAGGMIANATSHSGLAGKIAGEIAGVASETGIFAASAGIGKAMEEGIDITDVDWADTTGEALGMVIGMKAAGAVTSPREFLKRYRKSSDYGLQLNKADIEELKQAGYDFSDIFKGLGEFGKMAPQSATVRQSAKEYTVGPDGTGKKKDTTTEEAYVDTEAFNNVISNPVVSSSLKRKLTYIATGKILSLEPAFAADISIDENGKATIVTRNVYGNIIETKEYDDARKAQEEYELIKDAARANTIGGLERIADKAGFPDVIDEAKGRTLEETGMDVDNIDNLADLSKEDAGNVLDTYAKNLQEAYMKRFNGKMKEIGDAAGISDDSQQETVRRQMTERRQAAYDMGSQATEEQLSSISYESKMAEARLMQQMPDGSQQEAVRRQIMDAVQAGDVDAAERILQQHASYLSESQQEAAESYLDSVLAGYGVSDGMQRNIEDYEQQVRQQVSQYTDSNGDVTSLRLKDGSTVYYQSGDLAGYHSSIYVVTEDGETKQISTKDIDDIPVLQSAEQIISEMVQQYSDSMTERYSDLADGRQLYSGQQADIMMGNQLFHVTALGTDEQGNNIIQMEDGSRMALTKDQMADAVDAADFYKIQQLLGQEQDAAMEQERTERFNAGIVGYKEGTPNLSAEATDPAAAAEYLLSQKDADGQPIDRRHVFDGIDREVSNLESGKAQMRQALQNARNNLAMAEDGSDEQRQAEAVIAQLEPQLEDIERQRRKWGEIRQAAMTDEERMAFEKDRVKAINNAKTQSAKAVRPADESAGTEAMPTAKDMLEQYVERSDAEAFVEAKRKELSQAYKNDVYPRWDDIQNTLDDYQHGLTDMTPDDIKALTDQQAALEAQMTQMVQQQGAWKKLQDALPRVYSKREREQMDPHTLAMSDIAKESDKTKKLKLAQEAFKGDEDALSALDNQEPQDVYEWVADNLGAGSLNFEGFYRGEHYVRGVSDAIGKDKKRGISKDSDTNGFNYYLAPTGQGKGWDEIVHAIAEGSPYTTEEVSDALYNLLTGAKKPSDISHRIIDDRIARAEEIYQANIERERQEEEDARREAELEAENEAIRKMTGLEPEEYDAMMADLEQRLAEQEAFENSDDYFKYVEEYEQRTNGRGTGGGQEAGTLVVQGKESQPAGAEAQIAKGTGEVETRNRIEEVKAKFKALDKQYNGAPMVFLEPAMSERSQAEAIFGQDFVADKPDEEVHAVIVNILKASKKAAATYVPELDIIVIFADRIKPKNAAESYFHENTHAQLQRLYGDGSRTVAELFWNLTPEAFGRTTKEYVISRYSESEHKEEFFAYCVGRALADGDIESILKIFDNEKEDERRSLAEGLEGRTEGSSELLSGRRGGRQVVGQILGAIGYDRTKENDEWDTELAELRKKYPGVTFIIHHADPNAKGIHVESSGTWELRGQDAELVQSLMGPFVEMADDGTIRIDSDDKLTEILTTLVKNGHRASVIDKLEEKKEPTRITETVGQTDGNKQPAEAEGVLKEVTQIDGNPNYSEEEQKSLKYVPGESFEEYTKRNNSNTYQEDMSRLYLQQKYADRLDEIAGIIGNLTKENANDAGRQIGMMVDDRAEGYGMLYLLKNINPGAVLPFNDGVSEAFTSFPLRNKEYKKEEPAEPATEVTGTEQSEVHGDERAALEEERDSLVRRRNKLYQKGLRLGIFDKVTIKEEVDKVNKRLKEVLQILGQEDTPISAPKFSDRLQAAKNETNQNPTEDQKKAGNYKMGHISFGGYRMSIETPKGAVRSGKDANGKPWSIEMQDTYGYIGKKYGADKDHLDFFINDDADLDNWNGRVYVVDQKNEDGTFDEHKVMYGYPNFTAAKKAYERNYEEGWWDKHVMQMTGVRKESFDKWLEDSDHKRKPFADYSRTKQADTVSNPLEQLLADVEERKNRKPVEGELFDADLVPTKPVVKNGDVFRSFLTSKKEGIIVEVDGHIDTAGMRLDDGTHTGPNRTYYIKYYNSEDDYRNGKHSNVSSISEKDLVAAIKTREWKRLKPAADATGTVTVSFKAGELEAMSIDELRQLRKKRNAVRATSNVLLGTTNIQAGSLKERTLKNNIAQHEADMAAIDKVIEQKQAEQKRRIEQQEIGFAITDSLEGMGYDVETNPSEIRRVRKQAEKDNSEEGKLRHMQTADGQIYGFVYRGKMYLDIRKMDATMPLHEYGHPWCEAFRRMNPDGWKDVVNVMKSDKDTWDFVKQLNPDLTSDDDIAEEMIAKGTGEKGAEYIRREYERMNGKDPNYKSRWNNIWKNIAKAIQDFWKQVGDFLHIKYQTPEQVYDQVIRDFANKVNPRKRVEQWLKDRDKSYLEAVEKGDEAKAKQLFDEALRENIGNGMTPYVAVEGYRKMRTLAHGVKSRDPKVIAKVADMMAPIIPKDAVLIPAPSHTGKATDMLDLANAISERTGAPVADVLTSKERPSQYEAKYAGKPLTAGEMGITVTGEPLPTDKIPVVIDNVVDTGNTAEACIKALGKGVVATLADSVEKYSHVASLKSAEPVVTDKKGNIIPLSERFDFMIEGNLFTDEDFEELERPADESAGTEAVELNMDGINVNSPIGKKLIELKKEAGTKGLVGYTYNGMHIFPGMDGKTIDKLVSLKSMQHGTVDGMDYVAIPDNDLSIASARLVKKGYMLAIADTATEPDKVTEPNKTYTYNIGDKLNIIDDNGEQHSVDIIGFDSYGNVIADFDGYGTMPVEPVILDMYRKRSEDAMSSAEQEPQDAIDKVLNEVEKRKDAAKVKAEQEADRSEAEKTIEEYLKVNEKDSETQAAVKRATKAQLQLLKDNNVPVHLASKQEERNMLKLFSLFNQEAVKEFARKAIIRAGSEHGTMARYIVYNMEDPFGVPMYAEKLSVAKEILDFMRKGKGSWELMFIGSPDEEVNTPEELKNAANFQAEIEAWHGSGAKFDAFDHKYMSSGEGGQAYGWGTYVTEVEGIGKMYAEAMGDRTSPATYKGIPSNSIALMPEDEYKELGAANEAQRNILAQIVNSCNYGYGDPVAMIRVKRESLQEMIDRKQAVIEDVKEQLIEEKLAERVEHMKKQDRTRPIAKERLAEAEKRLERLNNRIRINEKIVKETQEELDYVNSLDPKDFKGWSKPNGRYLYKVDIPEDTGDNYFDWTQAVPEERADKILAEVRKRLLADGKYGWNGQEDKLDKQLEHMKTFFGESFYWRIATMLGNSVAGARKEGHRMTSKLLSDFGYVGVKYPAQYRSGGREDGAKNYVIFNEKDAKITDTIQFMVETTETEAPVFYSNAMKAVEGIKQEKGTPDQWLAMIQKNGGLKAGEDKWLQLSDWLNELKKIGVKSVAKESVLEYIREHQIEVKDVKYSENASKEGTADKAVFQFTNQLTKEAVALSKEKDIEVAEASEQLLNERYGDKWDEYVEVDSLGIIRALEFTYSEDIADFFGIDYDGKAEKPIESTRLEYTTKGLDNKREIALVVPSIEPYNEGDDIHFGDAGRGRAVAWGRFGDVTIDKSGNRVYTTHDDFVKAMQAKYDGEMGYALRERMTVEERQTEDDLMHGTYQVPDNVSKICVIDEIQSKRHQDAREKGYQDTEEVKKLRRKLNELKEKGNEITKKQKAIYNSIAETDEVKAMLDENGTLLPEYREDYNKIIDSNEELKQLNREWIVTVQAARSIEEDLSLENTNGVPIAPFEKNWHELAMKRMLRYAAENGYDKIAWTTGAQQAERYNIGDYVNSIERTRTFDNGETRYDLYDKKGNGFSLFVKDGVVTKSNDESLEGKSLSEVVGKDLASKMQNMQDETTLEGTDIVIGGEGMKGFYDQILPRFMNKYCKKWGTQVTKIELPNIGKTMWSVDITPEMRESVMQGQPMFQADKNGILGWSDNSGITLTEKGLNPNTPIHECNHLWDRWCIKEQPDLWKNVVAAMKKTKMWDEIKKNPAYRHIWDDDDKMASEVKSRLSGIDAEEEFVRAAFKKNTAQSIINEVKSVLRKFWESILRLFGKTGKTSGSEWNNERAIVKMTLRDLLEGDFEKVMRVAGEEPAGQVAGQRGNITLKAPNGKKSNLNVFQYEQVRTDDFKKYFGDWEKAAKTVKISKPGNIEFANNEEFLNYAKEHFMEMVNGERVWKSYLNKDSGNLIKMSSKGINKSLSNKAVDQSAVSRKVHLKALSKLDEILEESILGETHKDRDNDPNILEIQRYYGAVLIDGDIYRVKTTVKKVKGNKCAVSNNQYSFEIQEIELKEERPGNQEVRGSKTANTSDISNNSISAANLLNKVESSKKNGEKLLDVSQIVDENGEPLVVYHNTDLNSWLNRENEGKPFHVFNAGRVEGTDFIKLAHFGTKEQAERRTAHLVERNKLREELGMEPGYEVYQYAVYLNIRNPKRVKDFGGNEEAWMDAAIKAQEEGYDGLVYANEHEGKGDSYAVWNPAQIKSATENVGTFDGMNPDIRFHIEGDPAMSENKRIRTEAEANGTFMKAPDGSRSKLSEKEWVQARTKGFKKWIGGDWEETPETFADKLDTNGEPQEKYVQGYIERPRKPRKPKKKEGDTDASYFNKLRMWEKAVKDWPETEADWKALVAAHKDKELPDEDEINARWETQYKQDLAQWKADNALSPDAVPPGAPKPASFDPIEYIKYMADYRRRESLWKTAPEHESYMRQAEDELYSMLAERNLTKYPLSYSAQLKKLGADMTRLNNAVSRQKRYDQETVKAVVDFAKDFMSLGFGDHLGRGDIERVLVAVKNATGSRNIKKSVDTIIKLLVDNHLRNLEAFLSKMTNVRDKRLNPTGVEVQGELDLEGQRVIQEFRRLAYSGMSPDDINARLNDLADKIMKDPENRRQWEAEWDGAHAALIYTEGVVANKKACTEAENDIKDAEETYGTSGRGYLVQQQLLESLQQGLNDLRIERIGLYGQLFDELGGLLSESKDRAREFREREKKRAYNIHRLAAIDMSGKDANETHEDSWKKQLNNSAAVRLPLSSLGTFEQMMKLFGSKNPNGEGRLYNHFIRSYIDAVNNEQLGLEQAKMMLDDKASEMYGKKMRWSDLYSIERKLPTADISWLDSEGIRHTYTIGQGNLLAVYMWNKMNDGRMKLRKMGIDEETMENITNAIEPKLKELADWVQSEYLPGLRSRYNKVHEKEFGASMAEIPDYFPLRIIKDAIEKQDDLTADPDKDSVLPSTTTGSIIKRTVNSKPLDILHTDALSLVIEHVEEMEKWAAFTHWNKDINTLLNYNRFKNQVKNMSTLYGSGDKLWKGFRAAAQIAAGTYRPKHGEADKAITAIASGVTGAKIAFRLFTALKQLLSAPAALSDANTKNLAKYMLNPKAFWYDNWKWAMENIPVLRKRWHSRDMGDTRISDAMGLFQKHDFLRKWVAERGMWANGAIDVATCSAIARTVYETKLEKYLKQGYDNQKANQKALQDAAVTYNLTQQSSEGAFVSQIQKDRTFFSNMWTVFRNSSMSYTRQTVDALRNLKRLYGSREEMVRFMERQMREGGLSESQAKIAARAEYKRAIWHNIAKLAVCAFILPWFWELGSKVPYLIFGDDEEEKKKMFGEVTRKELVVGPVEGLVGGNAMNTLWGLASNRDIWKLYQQEGWEEAGAEAWKAMAKQDIDPLPFFSDMGRMFVRFGYDGVAGMQDLVNLAVQMGTGVNPATLTDPIIAAIDYSRGDMTSAKEIMLFMMRVIAVPSESSKNLFIDELGMTADNAKQLTYDEMARRYSEYMSEKDAPLFMWAYSDEADKKRRDRYQKRLEKDVLKRIDNLADEDQTKLFDDTPSLREPLTKVMKKKAGASKDIIGTSTSKKPKVKAAVRYYNENRTASDMMEDFELEVFMRKAKADINNTPEQVTQEKKAVVKKLDIAVEKIKSIRNNMNPDGDNKELWDAIRKRRAAVIKRIRDKRTPGT